MPEPSIAKKKRHTGTVAQLEKTIRAKTKTLLNKVTKINCLFFYVGSFDESYLTN